MTDHYVPKLRQRFLEDMRIKGLQPKTQTMYLRAMREFTRYLGRSPDSATPEELRAFQLDMKERGIGAPTFNNRLTVLSFFFATTCPRPHDCTDRPSQSQKISCNAGAIHTGPSLVIQYAAIAARIADGVDGSCSNRRRNAP